MITNRLPGQLPVWIAACCVGLLATTLRAQEDAKKAAAPAKSETAAKSGLIRLDKTSKVWIDLKRKIVVVEGKVALREGQLEMFACPGNTKSHESVVSVETKAYVVHAALLAVGAKVGNPVQFVPKYTPASGTEVDIVVLWVDESGKRHKARAQDWIRETRTGKPMSHTWVFAGSGFWVDELDGTKHYQAEDGDLICVSNFATATLDLPIESSQSNSALMFEAFTDNIPPIGTRVRLVLIPQLEKDVEKDAAATANKPSDPPKEDRPESSEDPDSSAEPGLAKEATSTEESAAPREGESDTGDPE